jgi:hypothetical protein
MILANNRSTKLGTLICSAHARTVRPTGADRPDRGPSGLRAGPSALNLVLNTFLPFFSPLLPVPSLCLCLCGMERAHQRTRAPSELQRYGSPPHGRPPRSRRTSRFVDFRQVRQPFPTHPQQKRWWWYS